MRKFALGGIVLAVVAALLAFGLSSSAVFADPVSGDDKNTMEVTPADAGLHGIGANFSVTVDVAEVEPTMAYKGVQFKLAWDDATLDFVSDTYLGPPACLYGGITIGAGTAAGDEAGWGGCAAANALSDTGAFFEIELQCIAEGTSYLHLESIAEDGTFGTATAAEPGSPHDMVLQDSTVECANLADMQNAKSNTAGPIAVAGQIFDYVLTAYNAGPNPANWVVIGDNLPEYPEADGLGPDGLPGTDDDAKLQKELLDVVLEIDGLGAVPCVPGYLPVFVHPVTGDTLLNDVVCDIGGGVTGTPILQPFPVGATATLTLTVQVPLWDAGKLNINIGQAGNVANPDEDIWDDNEADCAPIEAEDPSLVDMNLGCDALLVVPACVTIDKSPDASLYSEGQQITWTINVNCLASDPTSGLPCSTCSNAEGANPAGTVGPLVVDTLGANQAVSSVGAGCTDVGGNVVECQEAAPMAPGSSATYTIVTDVIGSANNLCEDDAAVTWADGEEGALGTSAYASAVCLPPTVAMQKDIDEDATEIEDAVNLFLEMGPDGLECLTVYELVSNAVNLAPIEGVGAYEFQLKYDHKIFDIDIEDSSWLSVDGARTVDCSSSIFTENFILWGCNSSGPLPGATAGFGPDAEVAAIITVCPEPDLVSRLTPGQENGVVRTLLDENCELASPLGDPLQIEVEGELQPAPGIVDGGMLEVCSDITITVRILEADLDLDCDVDLTDVAAIALRYGSAFGNLLYDPWFDLEPALKDFDIDIKDLQKVFGRIGSTCDDPIPAQDPIEPPF
jgi:uncharacterized repeat protein (TIGR01451 family)